MKRGFRASQVVAAIAVAATLAGCAGGDVLREEGFAVVPGNEFRAENNINRFMQIVADRDYGAACDEITVGLQAELASQELDCRTAMKQLGDSGIYSKPVKVLGSEKPSSGQLPEGDLVLRTNIDYYFVMEGDQIAGISSSDPLGSGN